MKRELLSLILSFTILFCTNIYTFAGNNPDKTAKITIIHTNDTHGRVLAEDGGFGFAKIAAIAKKEKTENPSTFLIDAGDTLHGMPIINASRGEGAVKILNAAGYNYMTPGNHDFNYGYGRLKELNAMAEFKMLSANIKNNNGGRILKDDHEIININGVKVGIFGLTTPDTNFKTNPLNVKNINFENPIEIAQKEVNELKNKTDVIIAVVHMGLDESSTYTSREIAEKVNGIDVIIDGHSHSRLDKGLVINNTLIAQTGEYGQYLGKVEINVKGKEVISKKAQLLKAEDYVNVIEDNSVLSVINEIKASNYVVFSEAVAVSEKDLDGARENVRTKETEIGNLSADSVRSIAGADIGFINGGGIRTSIEKGTITKGKVAELFPFGNIVQVVKINGSELKEALELSVGSYPEPKGGFLQVSGITFTFDAHKKPGSRVSYIKVNGEDVHNNKEYTVATNDYLAQGGDGYHMFKKNVIAEYGTLDEIFADYINSNGTKNCDLVRIIVLNANESSSENNSNWETLVQHNNFKNRNLIYAGNKIKIHL